MKLPALCGAEQILRKWDMKLKPLQHGVSANKGRHVVQNKGRQGTHSPLHSKYFGVDNLSLFFSGCCIRKEAEPCVEFTLLSGENIPYLAGDCLCPYGANALYNIKNKWQKPVV